MKENWRTIAAVVVAAVIVAVVGPVITGYLGTQFMGAVATGALAGAASGAIMTGTLKGAMKGALFGAIGAGVAFEVAEVAGHLTGLGFGSTEAHAATLIKSGLNKLTAIKTMLHGLSRGIISRIQGGSFKAGFMSGLSSAFDIGTKAFGSGAGGFTMRTTVMAIVGGTASALGGGKFSNGAVSGAFVHMFNAEAYARNFIRGFTKDVSRAYRALSMMSRSQSDGYASRGLPSLSYSQAYDRVLRIEAMNDTIGQVMIAGAGGLLLAPVAEAGYAYAMVNPVSTYNFSVGALDAGWSQAALGLRSLAGGAGEVMELIIKGL